MRPAARARAGLCGLASLVLAACTSASSQAPDAGLPDLCSTDAECQPGFRCDRGLRRCVCTGDDACPGRFCNAFTGQCVDAVPGCTADSACLAGEYCDRGLRSCKPLVAACGACVRDAQCGPGRVCAAHPQFPSNGTFCVATCGAGADGGGSCAAGTTCLPRAGGSVCFPGGGCGLTNACAPDSFRVCAKDADCGDPAQVCDLSLTRCVAKVRGCQAGFACDPQQKICVAACTADADCLQIEGGAGYRCRAGACARLTLCTADTDCAAGQICDPNPDGSKSCRPGCVSNGDCPLGQSCDATRHRCAQGCSQPSDCALDAVCSGGLCATTVGSCAQSCQTTMACPVASSCASGCCTASDLAQVCKPGCAACDARVSCAGGCDPQCFVAVPHTCGVQADCADLPGSTCVPNPPGPGQCRIGVHVQPCTDDASCPSRGFRCLGTLGCATGRFCVPYEQSAMKACALGHL